MRNFFKTVAVICLPILLWLAFVLFHKEALDEGLEGFYQPRQVTLPKELDASVFLDGLTAPVGTSVVEHGALVRNIYQQFKSDDAQAKARIHSLGEVSLTLEAEELDCWIYGQEGAPNTQPCASSTRLRELLKINQLLLQRYQDMMALNFGGNSQQNLQLFIHLNKLLSAQIIFEAKNGRSKLAFQKWKTNFDFLSRAGKAPGGLLHRAVVLVNYGIAQATLESLLHINPALAKTYQQQLLGMLDIDIEQWPIDPVLRGDYSMLERDFFSGYQPWYFDVNFVRNRVYRSDLALLDVLKTAKPASIGEDIKRGLRPHADLTTADYILNPWSASISRTIMHGRLKSADVIAATWEKVAYNRLLALRVRLAQGHAVTDALSSPSPDLRSPFNDKPMNWSEKQKNLWFGRDGCSSIREVRLPGGRFLTEEELSALRSTRPDLCH